MSYTWELDAGRCIVKDKKPFATIHGVSPYSPVGMDEFARMVVNALNVGPELLEACKKALQSCPCSVKERLSGHRVDCYVPIVELAIAKAEGR